MKRGQAALAVAFAVGAHALALLALGWPKPAPEPLATLDALPAIELSLVRIRPPTPAAGPAKPSRTAPAPAAPSLAPRVLIAPTPAAPVLSAPNPSPAPDAGAEATRSALRGLLGCTGHSGYRLSDQERDACDRRLAAAKPAAVGAPYSDKEAAAFSASANKESIFTRKPHNECLPHAGNTDGPAGSGAGNTTLGIACAWSFW